MLKSEPRLSDHRLIHQQIAADLRDQIMSGDFASGSSLPSTRQLREHFGASTSTIQRAVQLLKDEGLAHGRAGSAVTVQTHRRRQVAPVAVAAPARPGHLPRQLAENTQRGFPPGSTLLSVAVRRPPADVCAVLDLGRSSIAVLREEMTAFGGERAELVQAYYPLELVRGTPIAGRRVIDGGALGILAAQGHRAGSTEHRITACVPTREQFALLQLPSELPVLRTLRIVYSDCGRPIEAAVVVKAGHLYELHYTVGAS